MQRALGNGALAAGAEAAEAVRALGGSGAPIDSGLRPAVERAVGQDLGDVRVHTGPRVRVAARAAGAAGFTIGRDIGIATGPGQDIPLPLLIHEAAHAVQQSGGSGVAGAPKAAGTADAERQAVAVGHGAGPAAALSGTAAPYVAWAPEEWLTQPAPDVRRFSLSQLLDELRAADEWLARQPAATPSVELVQEVRASLVAELGRRRQVVAGTDEDHRSRARQPWGPWAPAPEVVPDEVPLAVRDRNSRQLTDPAEIRAEVDRIAAWLARPDISDADRRTLQQQLARLGPGFDADLDRAGAQRRLTRLKEALAPAGPQDRASILANIRLIESIRPYTPQPGMAFVMHRGELLVFPQETADAARAAVIARLGDAARRAGGINASTSARMIDHRRQNDVEQPIVGGIVSFFSGESATDVEARMLGPRSDSQLALQRFVLAALHGSLVDMAEQVLTAIEKAEEAQRIVLAGIGRYTDTLGSIVHGLEITRDLGLGIGLAISAVLAAPVVGTFVAGTGATGLTATGLTAVGTGAVVGAEGAGIGFLGGAGGELVAGGSPSQALRAGGSNALRIGAQGVAAGVSGGAAYGLARNLGVGAVGLTRLGSIGRNALAQGGGSALGGATGGLLTPPQGLDRGEAALRGGLGGFASGAVGGAAGTYAQGLTSPLARWGVGTALPSVTAGGVTYLQTGNLTQSLETGATALTVNSLTVNRPLGLEPVQQRSFQLGLSTQRGAGAAGRFGRSVLTAWMLALSDYPALTLGESGASFNQLDPRQTTSAVGAVPAPPTPVAEPPVQPPPVQQTPVEQPAAQQPPVEQASVQQTPVEQASAQQAPAPQPPVQPTAVSQPTVRISRGAFTIDAARQVVDPFSGEVLGQRSASAQTRGSLITGIRADEGEAATWRFVLRFLREIGIQAPIGANVAGADFITVGIGPDGRLMIFVNDTKTSTTGSLRKPKGTKEFPRSWRYQVQAAIAPGRLDLGDPDLEAEIRQAFAEDRVELRQINADYSAAGQGSFSFPKPPTPKTKP